MSATTEPQEQVVRRIVLPPDPFWLLTVPVKPGEVVPFQLWMWWHWQWLIPKAEA